MLGLRAFLLGCIVGCSSEVPEPITLPAETVTVSREAANGRSWRAAFDVELQADQVLMTLRLRLIPGSGVTRPQLERWQASWETEVETRWSDHFGLLVQDIARPIKLDVRFEQLSPHHTVAVKQEAATAIDQLHWSRWSSEVVVAHEIGHMLGAYDEYSGGGQDPQDPLIDRDSIMGGSPKQDVRGAARHFAVLQSWARNRLGSAEVVPMEVTNSS